MLYGFVAWRNPTIAHPRSYMPMPTELLVGIKQV